MFTEIIKLSILADRAQLNTMFANLNSRFTSVARKFGEGMKNAFKFGGVVGIVAGLLSKLLNPLQKAEEIMDRILNKGDDAVTNAEEFNSDPGKLLRLEALGKAKGLDPETMRTLITKFQGALAKEQDAIVAPARIQKKLEAASDPLERQQLQAELTAANAAKAQGGLLHEFVNEKDTVEAFFKFVQSLQKVEPAQRTVVQSEIFGERIRGRASEFFNATDFDEILKQLPSAEVLKAAALKSGKLSDLRDLLGAKREAEDFVTKSNLVKESHVTGFDRAARLDLKDESETLKRLDATLSTSIAVQELTQKFDTFATNFINEVAPHLVTGIDKLTLLAGQFLPSFEQVKGVIITGFSYVSDIYKYFTGGEKTKGGIVDRVTAPVYDPTEPFPIRLGHEVNAGLDQTVASLSKDLNAFKSTFESIWADFKSSPIYRYFGRD